MTELHQRARIAVWVLLAVTELFGLITGWHTVLLVVIAWTGGIASLGLFRPERKGVTRD